MIRYFAYGSNMLTGRLRERVPSAELLGAARLGGFSQTLTKRSLDGSGKAAIRQDDRSSVLGVLFQVAPEDLDGLFAAESVGYHPVRHLDVRLLSGPRLLDCWSFVGIEDYLVPGLAPYDWYLDLMVAGAVEHGLPERHVETLRSAASVQDPDPQRPTRLAAIGVLSA